jgi:hypothetical protein
MWGIIPAVYAGGNSPVGGFVRLEGCSVEVEPAAGAVAHGGQRAAPHAVTDLVRRAVKVVCRRFRAQEAAVAGGWSGGCRDDGRRAPRVQDLLRRDAQQMDLRNRAFSELAHEFREVVK